MSKFFGKILSLVLTAALLLSVFSVFSFAAAEDENKEESTKTRDELIAENYSPCGTCKP
jgi:hypothetical protein